MVGLALEGGGAKGSYQAGAYMALKKNHIKIDAVCGTSIGAFNGALIASGDEKVMVKLWQDTSMQELLGIDDEKAMSIIRDGISFENIKWSFKELYKIFKNKGLDISNYRAVVRNNINEEKLRKSKIKYGLTTIKADSLTPLEVYTEDIPEGKLHDYIVASSYFPAFKKEKLIDDSYYLDGGFYNLCPTDMLEKIGCDIIYVVNIKGIGFRKPNKKGKAKIIEIKPTGSLGNVLIFDKQQNRENMAYGYYDALKVLEKLDGIEYYFKKKNNKYYEHINRQVDSNLYDAVCAVLNTKEKKETVLKALEYIMKQEKLNDLKIYNQKDIIKSIKNKVTDNIVYRYVRRLKTW